MGWGNAYSGQSVGSQPQVKSTVFNQQLLETEDAKYMESHIFMENYQYVSGLLSSNPRCSRVNCTTFVHGHADFDQVGGRAPSSWQTA